MSKADTQRSRTRRARARGVCPECGTAIDLCCYRCMSTVCRRCHNLTGSLYARECQECQEARRHD